MRESKLFGDEDSPVTAPPCITEISLKDLGTKIDFSALKSQNYENELQSGNDGDESCNGDGSDWFLSPPPSHAGSAYKTADLEHQRSSDDIRQCVSVPDVSHVDTVPRVGADNSSDSDASITEETELLTSNPKYSPIQLARHSLPNGHIPRQPSSDMSEPRDCCPSTEKQMVDSENMEYHSVIQRTHSSFNENKRHSHRKRRSCHEQNSRRMSDVLSVKYGDISKEDLLLMWKASETDLGDRLDWALTEKNKLEMRIAELDQKDEGVI